VVYIHFHGFTVNDDFIDSALPPSLSETLTCNMKVPMVFSMYDTEYGGTVSSPTLSAPR
jgi:hypothetical protein